jgi:hypothetical protein
MKEETMSEYGTVRTKEHEGETMLATHTLLEQRLQAVETALSELQRRLATLPQAPDWLEQIQGSCKDEPAFEEAMALGRALRMAQPFPEDRGEEA